jgi:hypothetical protein
MILNIKKLFADADEDNLGLLNFEKLKKLTLSTTLTLTLSCLCAFAGT